MTLLAVIFEVPSNLVSLPSVGSNAHAKLTIRMIGHESMAAKHVDPDNHDCLGRCHDRNGAWFSVTACQILLLSKERQQGFVKNYGDLFVTRLFLGTAEAGLFPGVSYFLTLWYRRYVWNLQVLGNWHAF